MVFLFTIIIIIVMTYLCVNPNLWLLYKDLDSSQLNELHICVYPVYTEIKMGSCFSST